MKPTAVRFKASSVRMPLELWQWISNWPWPYIGFLDLEATCEEEGVPPTSPHHEIILLCIVVVSVERLVIELFRYPKRSLATAVRAATVGVFDQLTKPVYAQISPFCKSLTGIDDSMLVDAPSFPETLRQCSQWILDMFKELNLSLDKFVLATCGNWDLEFMLPRDIERHRVPHSSVNDVFKTFINVKSEFRRFYDRELPTSLDQMCKTVGHEPTGTRHSAYYDSLNLAAVYASMLRDGYRAPYIVHRLFYKYGGANTVQGFEGSFEATAGFSSPSADSTFSALSPEFLPRNRNNDVMTSAF